MKTKLINIIEVNASMNYKSFYGFDIEKIFISDFFSKEKLSNNKTEYLSLLRCDSSFNDKFSSDLLNAISGCEHLIITGTMQNIASVVLKMILDLAQKNNIITTLLYCSMPLVDRTINENKVKYYSELIGSYKQVNFIHIDFKHYPFRQDTNMQRNSDTLTAFLYDATSVLVDMAKNNKVPHTATCNADNILYLEDFYDCLVDT